MFKESRYEIFIQYDVKIFTLKALLNCALRAYI